MYAALLRLSRHSLVLLSRATADRLTPRFDEHLYFYKIRCEIPRMSGRLDLQSLR